MAFLQGSMALLAGLVAFAVTVLLRRVAKDPALRDDLQGAVWHFAVFLGIRLLGIPLEQFLPVEWHPYLRVAWELSFAFGMVRLVVALVLGLRRAVRPRPAIKIHRDVADFVLYVLTAIPLLKMQLKIDVTTLLGTSAVLSLVLGFALQDTLSNLFSGLSLQFERPFEPGDYIKVGSHEGRVAQVSWRSMRIETLRGEFITLPNSLVAKEAVTNFTRGGRPVAVDLTLGLSFEAPPTLAKREILSAVTETEVFLKEPAPLVRLLDFDESSMRFQIRAWLNDYAQLNNANDELRSRLWYRLSRAGIEIPFPQRVVTTRAPAMPREAPREELLKSLDVFAPFSGPELADIARAAREVRFGAGERIVTEGDEGQSYYAMISGKASVRAGQPPVEIASLSSGSGFGEMSLLTGEPRAATVVAVDDCVLLELDREAFARHFTEHPERAAALATMLANRKAALERMAQANVEPQAERQARILERLRKIFRLA